MHNPKVSVLIPAYNYGLYLPEAIESALNQTFTDFELIVVDNCSNDNTQEIVARYAQNDSRVIYKQNSENIGMYRNYNQALLYANGEYIKFLNADDKLEPTVLEKFVNILDNDSTIALVTSYRQLCGTKSDVLIPPFKGKVEATTAILSSLEKGNWIGEPSTVMFRRKNLNLGLFDISIIMFADQDMWLRQLRVGSLYIVDEVLSYFRIHDEQGTISLTSDSEKRLFHSLQYAEFRRNSVLNMRFGYDLYVVEPQKTRKILNNISKTIIGLMYKQPSHNVLRILYSFKYVKKHCLISVLPVKVIDMLNWIRRQNKSLKSFLSGKKK